MKPLYFVGDEKRLWGDFVSIGGNEKNKGDEVFQFPSFLDTNQMKTMI